MRLHRPRRLSRVAHPHCPRPEGDCSFAARWAPAQSSLSGPRCRRDHLRAFALRLDTDLAEIYGVETSALNRAVKRNSSRFPPDFLFQITREEFVNLRCQIGISSSRYGGRRYLPYAFTENGAIMAANVLNSEQAVRMSVFVVRAFVRMRELLSGSRELAAELKKLEAKLTTRLDVHEAAIVDVLRRIMQLLDPPPAPPVPGKEMGFHTTMKRMPGKRRSAK